MAQNVNYDFHSIRIAQKVRNNILSKLIKHYVKKNEIVHLVQIQL